MPLDFSAVVALRGAIKASAERAPAEAGIAVNETGAKVANAAQQNAPVLTGELRSSIHLVRTGLASVEVRADSDHAGYVEDGTSVMAPEPYMGPAMDAYGEELPAKLLEHLTTGL